MGCAQSVPHVAVQTPQAASLNHDSPLSGKDVARSNGDVGSGDLGGAHHGSSGCPMKGGHEGQHALTIQEHGRHVKLESHCGETVQVNRCPFGHGSVGAGPFPGYVHGTNPTICKEGCKPDPSLGKYKRTDESPRQTLIREALEYQELYCRDKGISGEAKEARVKQILAEIEATGSYTHTFDELQHGARAAWRNAPKCCNRKFWEELRLVDGRHAASPAEMFEVCLEVLEKATLSCVTTANIAVFRPQTPGTEDGPRVWNNQLVRYAGYDQGPDRPVLGDPAEVEFTKLVMKEFGWAPPSPPGRFDILPVLLQAHPDQQPQLFELPSQYVIRVPIRHPTNEAISAMGLQWYAVPAVSCLELSVGGLTYTAAPFNGWYADTEIARNLTDETRYNLCAPVARCLGLEPKNDATMWRDRAIVEVTAAVMHSFREAGMGMVDHHTLMRNFFNWYKKEKARRGYCPGNWKWIITPVSPTASPCYLQLNKMTEYTIKPGYWYAAGWRKYWGVYQEKQARPGLRKLPAAAATGSSGAASTGASAASLMVTPGGPKPTIFVCYATVTGNTQSYVNSVAQVLSGCSSLQVVVQDVEEFEGDSWSEAMAAAALVVVATSTYGPGAPPGTAVKLLSWLQNGSGEAQETLKGKPFVVLGFGSSSYPRFCAAADLMHTLLVSVGAAPLMPAAKADALAGEESAVWPWLQQLAAKMQGKGWLDGLGASDLIARLPLNDQSAPPPFQTSWVLVRLSGKGLQPARERGCHWATLLETSEQLRSTSNDASTKLLRLHIKNVPCGSYYAGDELAVWAENSPDVVAATASALGITEGELDSMFLMQKKQLDDGDMDSVGGFRVPLPNSYRTVLTRHAGLSERITYTALHALSQYAAEDKQLQDLVASYDTYSDWAGEMVPRWQDLFKLFPSLVGRIPLETFFELMPLVKPRYYSISSSSAVAAEEVAICVGRLAYKLANGQERSGFCSAWLTNLKEGDRVRFKLVSQPAFRLPLNLAAPVVMVAAGTGLAPFRGFWMERALRLQEQHQLLGPAVLVYGCRSQQSDYLMEAALNGMVAAGALSQVLVAFSREKGVPKTYVQDIIGQRSDSLRPLLQHPRAHIYICGSSNMAQEVCRALGKVVGKKELDHIILEGRYHEDVFGITIGNHAAAVDIAKKHGAIRQLAGQGLADIIAKLDEGLDINTLDEHGSTLLHHAAHNDRIDLVATLLTRGAVVNPINHLGLTPMAEACLAGHAAAAAVLQSKGGARTGLLHSSFYKLHAAVMNVDVAAVQQELDGGADPDLADFQSATPLHMAVAVGSSEIVKVLLAAGANPNSQNRSGTTPLQLAVLSNKPAVVELLQAAGGEMNPKHLTAAAGGASGGMFNAENETGMQGLGISSEDVARVRASWSYASGEAYPDQVSANLEHVGVQLFLSLFEAYPKLLDMFPFKDDSGKPIMAELKVHGLKVASTLGEVVDRLQNLDALKRYVTDLVERHLKYGVELVHYDIVLETMKSVLGALLGTALTPDDAAAWSRVIDIIKVVARQYYKA